MKINKFDLCRELLLEEPSPVEMLIVFDFQHVAIRASLVAPQQRSPLQHQSQRRPGSIPASGRHLRGGNGNPPQNSCLENSMNRGAWRATVPGVTNRRLKRLTSSSSSCSRQTTFTATAFRVILCVGANIYFSL